MGEQSSDMVVNQLAQEFLDETREQLDEMLVKLSSYQTKTGGVPRGVLTTLMVKFQSLAAQVSATKFRQLEKHMIEFNRALAGFSQIGTDELDAIMFGLEDMRQLVDQYTAQSLRDHYSAPAPLIPAPPPSNIVTKHVLLICNERTLSLIIGRAISEFGFAVHLVRDMAELPGMLNQYHPYLIVCNATLGSTSGVEIAQNLQADPSSRDLPFALLTSFDLNHPMLANLPKTTPIIRKGEYFIEDFKRVLQKYNL